MSLKVPEMGSKTSPRGGPGEPKGKEMRPKRLQFGANLAAQRPKKEKERDPPAALVSDLGCEWVGGWD